MVAVSDLLSARTKYLTFTLGWKELSRFSAQLFRLTTNNFIDNVTIFD